MSSILCAYMVVSRIKVYLLVILGGILGGTASGSVTTASGICPLTFSLFEYSLGIP